MKKILSCCPIAAYETMHLVPANFQFQPGKAVSALTAKVCWLQETEATVLLCHGDQVALYGGRYGDREGYLSAVDQAFREGKQLINSYQLDSKSRDNIRIEVSIVRTPVFELFSQDIKFSWDKQANWRQYDRVAHDWMQIQYPDQPISNHNLVRPIKPVAMLEQEVIWSSRLDPSQHLDTIRDFKDKWIVDEPVNLQLEPHANKPRQVVKI